MTKPDSLTVNEIFQSIQGESTWTGYPCVFIRLSGCDLRCKWCDTEYAFTEGTEMSIPEILRKVAAFKIWLVTVTGGEPLIQEATPSLLTQLCDSGHVVILETAGHRPFHELDSRVIRIVDLKCPSSGMVTHNRYSNYRFLRGHDEVKFVLANREDYEFALDAMERYDFGACETFLLSPAHGALEPDVLARWMLEDAVHARLHLQTHKMIWPRCNRGV
jgi:7-carboxy-7-deazaguanine synthase